MWKARLSELEFDETELSGVLDALDSEWITSGPRTHAFEKAFAELTGATDAIAVTNGTAALFLAMKALDIGPGDEVLVPSLTFVATAAAVLQCGATPVFVDICSLENPTMDGEDAEKDHPTHKSDSSRSLRGHSRQHGRACRTCAFTRPRVGRGCGSCSRRIVRRTGLRDVGIRGLLQFLRKQEHHNGRRRHDHHL